MSPQESDDRKQRERDSFDMVLRSIIHGRLHKLIGGHVTAHLIDAHQKQQNKKKKKINEEAPTNVMGTSSSVAGSGPIDTFDPLLKFKSLIKRRKQPKTFQQ